MEVAGERKEELAHQEHTEGPREPGEDQRLIAVQPSRIREHEVEGNKRDLGRDHEARHDDSEDERPPPEPQPRQRIACGGIDGQDQQGLGDGHERAVEERPPDIRRSGGRQRDPEVLGRGVDRHPPDRQADDLRLGLEPGQRDPGQREKPKRGQRQQRDE